jgi:hypothetical protein
VVAIASHPFTANELRVLQVYLLAAYQWEEPQPVRIGDVVRMTRLGRGPAHIALGGLKAQLMLSPVEGQDGLLQLNAPADWKPRAARRCGFARVWDRSHDENAGGVSSPSSLFLKQLVGVATPNRSHHEYANRSHHEYANRSHHENGFRVTKEACHTARQLEKIEAGRRLDLAGVGR